MNPQTHSPAQNPVAATPLQESLDIRESGALKNGIPQISERRLFIQLQVFTECADSASLVKSVQASGLECVVYTDINDPRGVGLLIMTEDPGVLVGSWRKLLNQNPFSSLTPKSELTMLGRTYSTGREPDLEDWLLHKPRRNALDPKLPWHVWYPLRRKPEFELLTKEEQGKILYEHAKIGISYGQAGFAHDIRLACHGLDVHDNEFVLGIVGPDLYPLSRLVQDMRKTQQTARYMQSLGPFFVGKVIWQSPLRT